MDYWMVMKWNELVLDYNVIKSKSEGKEMNLKTMKKFPPEKEVVKALLL